MMTAYKRAMDRLTMSPVARKRIASRLRRGRVRRRSLRPVLIAAAVLALALGTTAAAGGVFYHDIPAAIAQLLTPVRLSDSSQDIALTVQSASVEDGVFTAYITMRDERDSGRLAQGVDLYDSYRINTPYRTDLVTSGCTPLGYDEASRSYGFLIQIKPRDGRGRSLDFSGDKFTFCVRQLLLGQSKGQAVSLCPDWSTIPLFPANAPRYILGGSGEGVDAYSGWLSGGEALVLRPGGWELPVTEGVSVSAAGFMEDGLHIQLRFEAGGPDDHGWLDIVTPSGETVQRFLGLSFRDEDGVGYQESVYDVSPETLPGCTLAGEFTTGGYLLEGGWQVTFQLENPNRS